MPDKHRSAVTLPSDGFLAKAVESPWLWVFLVLAIMESAAIVWAQGLNPPTLWFDDVWVASLAKLSSFWAVVTAPAPTPPGFLALEWLLHRAIPDPELSVQVLPFAVGLATIPAIWWLVRKLTSSRLAALTAAAALVLDPWIGGEAVAVKQYTLDALISLLLLLFALRLFARPPTARRLLLVVVVALVSIFFSFYSAFLGAALVAVEAVRLARAGRGGWKRALGPLVLYLCGLFAIREGVLQGRAGGGLTSYWVGYFLPLNHVARTLRFLFLRRGPVAVGGGMPFALKSLAILALPGWYWLWRQRGQRPLAVALLLLYLGLPVASALHLYPLGGYRTDLFLHPVTLALVVLGLHAIVSWARSERLRVYTRAVPLAAFLFPALLAPPVSEHYPPAESRKHLDSAIRALQRGDLLLWSGQWMIAYYGPWQYDVRADSASGTSFRIVFRTGPRMVPIEEGPAAVAAMLPCPWTRDSVQVVGSTIKDAHNNDRKLLQSLGFEFRHGVEDEGVFTQWLVPSGVDTAGRSLRDGPSRGTYPPCRSDPVVPSGTRAHAPQGETAHTPVPLETPAGK